MINCHQSHVTRIFVKYNLAQYELRKSVSYSIHFLENKIVSQYFLPTNYII